MPINSCEMVVLLWHVGVRDRVSPNGPDWAARIQTFRSWHAPESRDWMRLSTLILTANAKGKPNAQESFNSGRLGLE